MSALARILTRLGHTVTGSDSAASAVLDGLRDEGVRVAVGHRVENVPERVDLVAVSSAVPDDNVELAAARRKGARVLSRADVLAALTRVRRTIAVAGTHGKTTTSAMIAAVLECAGLQPSVLIGGMTAEPGAGSRWNDGEWFVAEADESDGTFLALRTHVAVVTSLEPDHVWNWGDYGSLVEAFHAFLAAASGPKVVCSDYPEAAKLAAVVDASTYGTDATADLWLSDVTSTRSGTRFKVTKAEHPLGEVAIRLPGEHNALNALASITACMEIGVPFDTCTRGLAGFAGVRRRFETRGEAGGVTYIDDYAHLPTEVAGTIAATRSGGWDRIVAVFQPHRYTRTEASWQDFADAFVDADVVVITDVYPFGEPPRPGVTGKLVADAVTRAHPRRRVEYVPERGELAAHVAALLQPGDLCLTLGAGDLTRLPDELLTIARAGL